MKPSDIEGLHIVLTGTFTAFKRPDAEAALRALGAVIGSTPTAKTAYLFAGERAGSKLAKAQKLGITVLGEAELAPLVAQAPAAAPAPAKAAQPAEPAGPPSEIALLFAELKDFVKTYRRGKGMVFESASFGSKTSPTTQEKLRKMGVPEELIELYGLSREIQIKWIFEGSDGNDGGSFRLPNVKWAGFSDDDQHYMNFGDDQEAMMIDEITEEGNTWLVRTKGSDEPPRIIFASAAEGADGVEVASSIADYVRQALANAFVFYWPRCFKENPRVNYSVYEKNIKRFREIDT